MMAPAEGSAQLSKLVMVKHGGRGNLAGTGAQSLEGL